MHEMEYEMTEGMNHRKVNYYTRNIVHETSHFLLRPQSPKAGKSSRLLSLIPQWVSAAVPTSAGGWVGRAYNARPQSQGFIYKQR